MRKFKTCRPRALPVRSLVIVAGALLLMAAFAPSAKADVIAYYNFEDGATLGTVGFYVRGANRILWGGVSQGG